jgi:hypothetical protein
MVFETRAQRDHREPQHSIRTYLTGVGLSAEAPAIAPPRAPHRTL